MIHLLFFPLPLHVSSFTVKVDFLLRLLELCGYFSWLIFPSLLACLWYSLDSIISNIKSYPRSIPCNCFWILPLLLHSGKVIGLSFLALIHLSSYLSLHSNMFLIFFLGKSTNASFYHIFIYIFFSHVRNLYFYNSFSICLFVLLLSPMNSSL